VSPHDIEIACPPYRGEFGHMVMWHAPWFNALDGKKLIVCEKGYEPLYPSADIGIDTVEKPDGARREWTKYDQEEIDRWKHRLTRICPNATIVEPPVKHPESSTHLKYFQPMPDLAKDGPDIVVCPRYRDYGEVKNWEHWRYVAHRLTGRGKNVLAVGKGGATADCGIGTVYGLAGAIRAMRRGGVVVATDSGLAHLAVMCGTQLLLIGDNGNTAPGYGPIKMKRFERANHRHATIVLIDGWNHPDRVISKAMDMDL
jgi:ADP-heptose:LPS heptosyltransferase